MIASLLQTACGARQQGLYPRTPAKQAFHTQPDQLHIKFCVLTNHHSNHTVLHLAACYLVDTVIGEFFFFYFFGWFQEWEHQGRHIVLEDIQRHCAVRLTSWEMEGDMVKAKQRQREGG